MRAGSEAGWQSDFMYTCSLYMLLVLMYIDSYCSRYEYIRRLPSNFKMAVSVSTTMNAVALNFLDLTTTSV